MAVSSRTDLKTKKFYVVVLAEFIGTLLLVLVACRSTLQGVTDLQPAVVRVSVNCVIKLI